MQPLSNTRPMLCPELVGRAHELQELNEVLQRAATGKPQLVLLAGEAGMGKTRLCRAFLQTSRAQQVLVLLGQAIAQDQALPFGPFLDAFRRSFTASMKTLPHVPGSLHTPLASLLQMFPELASTFSGSISLSSEFNGRAMQSQQAVFHGILNALQELAHASSGPLLLILEDLHWADESSLELLAFLAQRFDVNATSTMSAHSDQSTPLMLLGTYRVDALSDNPALNRLLLQLRAQRHVHDIHLPPLNQSDHRHYVNSILGQPVSKEFTDSLYNWDEGNPFFTEELLGAMATSGQLQVQDQGRVIAPVTKPRLPSSLTEAILERFTRLPQIDQEVLVYAAVIGRQFDFPLLATLCHIDEPTLVAVLRQAIKVQLISEVSAPSPEEPEHYQFRHALTREAIYGQMLASERRLRHRSVAETLEQLATDPSLAPGTSSPRPLDEVDRLLAEHFWQAGLLVKARPYALHEAERARRICAFREERYYLNMVQASLPLDSPERLKLLQRMGLVSLGSYDLADALHWLTLAKIGYQRTGQHRQALQIMANLLFANWFLSNPSMPEMVAEIEAAAERTFTELDSANGDAGTLAAIANFAHYWTVHGLYNRSAYWLDRCFALFEALDDPGKVPAIQLSYITRAWFKAQRHASDFEEGLVEIRQAINTASAYSLPDVMIMGYATMVWMLIYWGREAEAERVLQEAAELEERSGMVLPSLLLGWQHFFSGERWDQGIKQLLLYIERLDRLHVVYLTATVRVALAHLLLARNDLAEASMHLQAAQPGLESNDEYIYLAPFWWGLAKLQRIQGNPVQTQEWYEHILKRWKNTQDTITTSPLLLDGILFYIDTGDSTKARQWLVELETVMQVTDNPVGAAALLEARGALKAVEGAFDEALPLLRQAVEAWRSLKWRYYHALASQRLATVLLTWASNHSTNRPLAQAAREEAAILLDGAEVVYTDLQVSAGLASIQALRGQSRLDAQEKRRSTMLMQHGWQGLTSREREVLRQLAAGKSNKDIAAALHITIGTVELHVSHILDKLGCESRTQAATYALEHGWVNAKS
ncbi:MAG TPA: AAA family ATPase [Ktedonobacteraceae bacterium]